ncbi:MAG: hypothetical protein NZ551_01730 [Microscillaceae bacterium]|nr:hypothetical protein [Microscillaceae bacterium]MDW8459908.1 hypothetical protein [Cytophagales bacterium]
MFFVSIIVNCVLISTYVCAQKENVPQIRGNKRVKRGHTLKIEIKNTTGNHIYLFDPMELQIEQKVGEKWQPLQVPYCPCDKVCPAPQSIKEMDENETAIFTWDLHETLCENNQSKKRAVAKGKYRFIMHYGTNPSDRRNFVTHEFSVR